MKRFTLILSLLFLSISIFSQRLEEKPVSNLDDNTLFAVQDSGQLYNWRKISFDELKSEFNIFRTPYGNVASSDSTILKGNVLIYDDSLRIGNAIIKPNRFEVCHGVDGQPDSSGVWVFERGQIYMRKFRKDDGIYTNPHIDLYLGMPDNAKPSSGMRTGRITMGSTGNRIWLGGSVTDSLQRTSQFEVYTKDSDYNSNTPSLIVAKDTTVVNNTLVANDGLKLSELSYTPTSSTDLQAEAAAAEVGTMWQLNISGSWYLVTKISATTLARTAFSEW